MWCPPSPTHPSPPTHTHTLGPRPPSGYKAKTAAVRDSTGNTLGAYDIEVCPVGEVSNWSGNTRNPAVATNCAPCLLNTYAPRTGEP